MRGGTGEAFRGQSAAVPNGPAAGQGKVVVEQVDEAAFETAANVGGGNVVSAQAHPLTHAGDGLRGAGKPEV